MLAIASLTGWAADAAHETAGKAVDHAAAQAHDAHAEHHGLPPAAVKFHIGPLMVTNSMIVTLLVALVMVIVAQLATRNVESVPNGIQNFVEWLVDGMHGFICTLLGEDMGKRTFWFFGSLFFFILFTNWAGLIPGVGTITYGGEPILRGGNADLNTTSAMAVLFTVLWFYWSVSALGPGGFLKHIFAAGGGGNKGFMGVFMIAVFFFVGVIEVISIAFRPVSLSFRLFGNVFAGENILESMMTIVPWLGWIIPLPFYFLELLVGIVQALVFTLLTAVFTSLMCSAHGHEEHGHHGHDHH
ncbi:MAG: ATP synthase F0 subunit A [Verrucomicrobia bacterium]|nr:ATP synthase F0 subunit A [Verrucomicrobiota bacterium]NBU07587.1 ATP synthase F0 subunit A [Pseudomonadota bacterium]NDB74306.1 ATP synthase F0 subunit A [Verrucomicrobiota bacterium]